VFASTFVWARGIVAVGLFDLVVLESTLPFLFCVFVCRQSFARMPSTQRPLRLGFYHARNIGRIIGATTVIFTHITPSGTLKHTVCVFTLCRSRTSTHCNSFFFFFSK
jgi:hypothetical protein